MLSAERSILKVLWGHRGEVQALFGKRVLEDFFFFLNGPYLSFEGWGGLH